MHPIHIDDNIYEINESGERVLVKSVESVQQAYIRFTNRTTRPVNVWWRNFDGHRRHYIRLEPGAHYNVNTYLTHPWEFTDAATGENFVINNSIVFRVPNVVAGMRYRTNWNISIPVRTLRYTTMLTLAERLPDADTAIELDLPRDLGYELHNLVNNINSLQPILENK